MDPSELLIFVQDSFNAKPVPVSQQLLPPPYRLGTESALSISIQTADLTTTLPPDPRYCSVDRYLELQQLKDQFDESNPRYVEARNMTNPFENINRSIFMNRAAIKLANIDAMYNLTLHYGGINKMVSDGIMTFCDVAGGPGGFTQYLQFRRPDAMGYGITLKNKMDWDRSKLDVTRIDLIYGDDGTGNICANADYFVRQVMTTEILGVDLVVADGGFDIETAEANGASTTNSSPDKYRHQEFLSTRLILCELLIAIRTLKVGGTLVCKVFDTVTSLSAQLLYLAARCFDQISLFKPISSRPANAERYLICQGRRERIESYAQILAAASAAYSSERNVISILTDTLPADFTAWLKQQNSASIERQLTAATRILRYLENDLTVLKEIPLMDTDKALIIWNLPDTPLGNRSKIRLIG
jgi:cap1 methyltransferase